MKKDELDEESLDKTFCRSISINQGEYLHCLQALDDLHEHTRTARRTYKILKSQVGKNRDVPLDLYLAIDNAIRKCKNQRVSSK
jgi:hypothetical protein